MDRSLKYFELVLGRASRFNQAVVRRFPTVEVVQSLVPGRSSIDTDDVVIRSSRGAWRSRSVGRAGS